MSTRPDHPGNPGHPDRRAFLKSSTGLTAGFLAAPHVAWAQENPPADPPAGESMTMGRAFYADTDQTLHDLRQRGIRANPYRAGRSMAMGRRGLVATSHPTASQAGLDMLRSGGTAMDAAVAAAAVLNVVEPMSTGIGGDAFFLYHEAKTGKVHGLNGSGRSPKGLTREHFQTTGKEKIDPHSWEAVTVPGALDAWAVGHDRFGSKTFAEVLEPAIRCAQEGFPVTEIIGSVWQHEQEVLHKTPWTRKTYLVNDQAPPTASVFRNPNLAETFRQIAEGGRDAFYRGPIAREIVRYAQETGGFLTLDDFADHSSTWVDPISTNYRGYDVLQIPPNGQGLGVLMMLNILEDFDLRSMKHNSPEYLHLLIEAKKLAYADLYKYVADPAFHEVPIDALLSEDYAARRRAMIDPKHAAPDVSPGLPTGTDTVYLTAIDKDGNAASFINSVYWLFGSGITGGSTGVLLQNRGGGFTLEPGHFNEYAPQKRPYHTIIPGMVRRDGELYMSYGLMGGPMQPQGHVQFLLSHFDFDLNIQQANDLPRWHHTEGLDVMLEHGFPRETMEALEAMGHKIRPAGGLHFGGAQAVLVDPETGTYLGSSDPRKDGMAIGY